MFNGKELRCLAWVLTDKQKELHELVTYCPLPDDALGHYMDDKAEVEALLVKVEGILDEEGDKYVTKTSNE